MWCLCQDPSDQGALHGRKQPWATRLAQPIRTNEWPLPLVTVRIAFDPGTPSIRAGPCRVRLRDRRGPAAEDQVGLRAAGSERRRDRQASRLKGPAPAAAKNSQMKAYNRTTSPRLAHHHISPDLPQCIQK
jgi:hypothetical protein